MCNKQRRVIAMKKNQIKIHIIDGSGSMANRKENIKGSAISLSLKEADYKTSPFTRLVSVAGKKKPEMSPGLKDQAL